MAALTMTHVASSMLMSALCPEDKGDYSPKTAATIAFIRYPFKRIADRGGSAENHIHQIIWFLIAGQHDSVEAIGGR